MPPKNDMPQNSKAPSQSRVDLFFDDEADRHSNKQPGKIVTKICTIGEKNSGKESPLERFAIKICTIPL